MLGVGLPDGGVDDFRVIERTRKPHHTVGRSGEILQRLWVLAVIVDDGDCEVPPRGLRLHALDASPQRLDAISGRDDDAHARVAADLVAHVKLTTALARFDAPGDAAPLQRVGYGGTPGLWTIALDYGSCRRDLVTSCLQHVVDMPHL